MNDRELTSVGRNIRRLRRAAGLSQHEVASRLGLCTSALSMIEVGRNQPTLRIINQVLELFKISPNELFQVQEEQEAGTIASADPFAVRRVDDEGTRLTPSVVRTLDNLIDSVLALEDLAGAQKHALIPMYVHLHLSDAGLEDLAERMRYHMRIHDGVVFDYFELLESFGLRVLVVPFRLPFAGACYLDPRNENAFFVINSRQNAERQLFTLASQLGRLMLYTWAARRGGYPRTHSAERLDPGHAAAKFAAHFLMPARAIHATVAQLGIKDDAWTYELLLRIKHRFGVSAEAFLYRLDELHLIVPSLKQQLKATIKKHYKRTNYREPDDSRRILTPNGRLWDLVLTATLHHGNNHEELNEIKHELKRMKIVKV